LQLGYIAASPKPYAVPLSWTGAAVGLTLGLALDAMLLVLGWYRIDAYYQGVANMNASRNFLVARAQQLPVYRVERPYRCKKHIDTQDDSLDLPARCLRKTQASLLLGRIRTDMLHRLAGSGQLCM
jgi:hypothetical protein